MQKKIKPFAAVLLALLLVFSTAPAAFAAPGDSTPVTAGGSVTGDVDVVNPIITVAVPTTLYVALDPYELSGAGQIANPYKQAIFNRSAVPVNITFDLELTLAGGAVYQNDYAKLELGVPSAAAKAINLGLVGATTLTPASSTFTTSQVTLTGDTVAYVHDPTAPIDNYAPFFDNGTNILASISFALAKAVYTDTNTDSILGNTGDTISAMAAGNTGGASFAFYGALSTKTGAPWEDTDVVISGTYTVAPYLPAVYASVKANDLSTTGVNMIAAGPTYAAPGFIINDNTVTTYPGQIPSSKAVATNLEIPFYTKGLSVTGLTFNGYAFTEFSVSGNKIIINKTNPTDSFRVTSNGAKNMVLTLSDSSTYAFVINVTN